MDKMTPDVSSFLTKSSLRGFTAAAAASADGSLIRGVTAEEDGDTDVDDELMLTDESSTPYALRGFRGRAVGRLEEEDGDDEDSDEDNDDDADDDDDVLGLVDT